MKCPSCDAENDTRAEACATCSKPIGVVTRGALLGGRYEILEILGKGGMGIVYKARDRILDDQVALKVLRRELTADKKMASRFRSEIKLARRVSHPNVCLIHDYGESAGLNYISMEWLEGRDLGQLLAEHPAGLPVDEAFDVSIQVAEGLQAIHEAGIIHRDLKAPNIMRDAEGVVRLMDFGIAKETQALADQGITATGMVLGTPEYMSPEQCRGEKLTYPSDIYALGVLIFELFTGNVPFRGPTPVAILLKHIEEPFSLEGPAVERLPKSLPAILRKALEKQPDARFQTARSVAEALRQARTGTRRPAVPPSKAPPDAASPDAAPHPAQKERRSEPRLETPIDVVLRRLDASGQVLQEERTIVDNISRKGARVMTSMSQVAMGALVELEEVGGNFRVRATVRSSHTGGDHIPRLGLRFEAGSAPDRLVQTDDAREATRSMRLPDVSNSSAAAELAAPVPSARAASDEPRAEKRTATRIESPLEVWLKRLGADGAVIGEERTIAENIGRGGARVMTAMSELGVGETVLFEEVGGDFQARAAIRHAYVGPDRIRRLNLQFLSTSAPDRMVPTAPPSSQPKRPMLKTPHRGDPSGT